MNFSPYLNQIFNVATDNITDDLTKWRNFCFTQVVRIKDLELQTKMHSSVQSQKIQPLKSKYNEILQQLESKNNEYQEVCNNLESAQKKKDESTKKLSNATTRKSEIQRKKIFFNQFPEQFSQRLEISKQHLDYDIKELFEKSNKSLNTAETKLDSLIQKIQSITEPSLETEGVQLKYEVKKANLEQLATNLAIKFNEMQFPECKVELLPMLHQYQELRSIDKDIEVANRENIKIEEAINSASLESYEINIQTLQNQISQEAQRQKAEIEFLKSQYDLTDIQAEIDQCQLEISDLEHKLEEENKNISVLQTEKKCAIENANKKSLENEEIIKQLTKELNELSSRVPKHSYDTKEGEVNTIYNGPWFNF
ncbi:hypothetical protein TVAG_482270 [Trichomonas vaginalis G3]|uniref:Uncharacterized protein n=1 Tax=Trichomonas vaginalis (strain ATCC PRA-98 / G3) TaxID=412133 RepID=A2EBN6_TRIV3|nr:hypothetical protein TVAGG3_0588730 [Trichomonas vaginalis G3]EAY09953.1 hypothetical protein TVAG_482270 [Trichomonas vaginalis G3]KAI5523094.1 hypothetical protein TVAGG3_0588730 [Trichomonas vaginalis G3]|eukprot:XP_001322176.1 hypothetical protein [Trichomonas vaginalis G3]